LITGLSAKTGLRVAIKKTDTIMLKAIFFISGGCFEAIVP
jgi:hypothetical protein